MDLCNNKANTENLFIYFLLKPWFPIGRNGVRRANGYAQKHLNKQSSNKKEESTDDVAEPRAS